MNGERERDEEKNRTDELIEKERREEGERERKRGKGSTGRRSDKNK